MFRHTFSAFKEHKTFAPGRPWSVVELRYANEAFSPPHYADTVEILICNHAAGHCYVGKKTIPLQGQQVIFIAPGIIHSAHYQPYNGYVWVLKLQPQALQQYVQLSAILKASQCNFYNLPIAPALYSQVHALAELLKNGESSVAACISGITDLFAQLIQLAYAQEKPVAPTENDPFLYQVITWTEAHFTESIPLDVLATQMGYSKNYFCSKFKRTAGTSYIEYLTSVRITYACRLLQQGLSTVEVASQCGYTNPSYFIKRFRSITNVTPSQYVKQFADLPGNNAYQP